MFIWFSVFYQHRTLTHYKPIPPHSSFQVHDHLLLIAKAEQHADDACKDTDDPKDEL